MHAAPHKNALPFRGYPTAHTRFPHSGTDKLERTQSNMNTHTHSTLLRVWVSQGKTFSRDPGPFLAPASSRPFLTVRFFRGAHFGWRGWDLLRRSAVSTAYSLVGWCWFDEWAAALCGEQLAQHRVVRAIVRTASCFGAFPIARLACPTPQKFGCSWWEKP